MSAIHAIGKADGLKSFEQVRDIHLSSQLWSVENEFLTPTFKTKRPALAKHFKDVIDAMYDKLEWDKSWTQVQFKLVRDKKSNFYATTVTTLLKRTPFKGISDSSIQFL